MNLSDCEDDTMTKQEWTHGLHLTWYNNKTKMYREWTHPYMIILTIAFISFIMGVVLVNALNPTHWIQPAYQCMSNVSRTGIIKLVRTP